VVFDGQVDAQPLVVPGVLITAGQCPGAHAVVYVATEHNTVCAIDVHSGTVLLSRNLGPPVPLPLGCMNNGPNVGVNSTPVIDFASKTLHVMNYTLVAGPEYRLHALDLGSLSDRVAPKLVTASHTLNNGTTFKFNATYQRQRPALLLANGSIYAGFGSFCDLSANVSRGWLLGWTAGSLAPFPSNQLLDQQPTSPDTFFTVVDLDVGVRTGDRRCRQHPVRDGEFRLFRFNIRRDHQHSGERGEGFAHVNDGA
jgi:hypothetical protein